MSRTNASNVSAISFATTSAIAAFCLPSAARSI
jgi:hypothetical protein